MKIMDTCAGGLPAAAADADALVGATPYVPGSYTPSPVDMSWQIYVGFAAGVIPFAIGAWEFGKRIVSCDAVADTRKLPWAAIFRDVD